MKKRAFRLKNKRLSKLPNASNQAIAVHRTGQAPSHPAELIPYDEGVLERSRTQWQFGDWANLAKLKPESIQHHPERGQLALLIAAGHAQTGNTDAAKHCTKLALGWGCPKKLVHQILISGVYNSLGRIATLFDRKEMAFSHFAASVTVGSPQNDTELVVNARSGMQLGQLGFSSAEKYQPKHNMAHGHLPLYNASTPVSETDSSHLHHAWQQGRWAQLARLDNAEMSTQSNRAEQALLCAAAYQQLDDMDGLDRCSRLALDWGCPKSRINAYLAAGIRNTLAIADTLSGDHDNAAKNFTAALTVDHMRPHGNVIKRRVREQLARLKHIDVDKTLTEICKHIR